MPTVKKGSIIGSITEGGNISLAAAYQKPGNMSELTRHVDGQHVVVIERGDIDDVIAVLEALKKA